ANELEPGESEHHTLHSASDSDWFVISDGPGTCILLDDAVIPAGSVLRITLFPNGDADDPSPQTYYIHPGEEALRRICLGTHSYPWLIEVSICDGEDGPCPASGLDEEASYTVRTEVGSTFSGWLMR